MVLKILLFLMPSFSLLVKIYKKTGCTVPASGRKQPVFLCRFPNFFRIFILLLQFTYIFIIILFCTPERHFRISFNSSNNFSVSIGFAIWPFIPALKASFLSSSKAFAVIAIIGIFTYAESFIARICLAAS